MESSKPQQRKRTQLSVIIRDPVEKLNRSGINAVRYDDSSSSDGIGHTGRLFTAGRDSIIRVYGNLATAGGSNQEANIDKHYQMSLSHHTDWVNDIVLCSKTNTLYSASSDTTVKVWNSSKGNLLNTMSLHKDYVKCLSYAKDANLLASAGLDKNIFIWDSTTGVVLNPSGLDIKCINENKYSIYSLAMNDYGTVLASGSPENCIRLWDPRSCTKLMKLKGHGHNIRCLLINKDGTQCLSASSDNTIRLWSLGQQRCISTIEVHTEGVWCLRVNDSFTKVYSGGKDCRVYATDLKSLSSTGGVGNGEDASILVCEETAPILNIDFGHEQESLWVSTTNSCIKNWSLKPSTASHESNKSRTSSSRVAENSINRLPNHQLGNKPSVDLAPPSNIKNSSSSSSFSVSTSSLQLHSPLNTQPSLILPGTTSIKQYTVLNDKRYLVTKDTEDNVCVWDVLQAKKIESLGKENYEQAIKVRQRFISVPNWFTVDLKLGVVTINLDENECQSAWINFKDMDSNHVRQSQNLDLNEVKVNYGMMLLESLFKSCSFLNPNRLDTCNNAIYNPRANAAAAAAAAAQQSEEMVTNENERNGSIGGGSGSGEAGLLRFNIPDHTTMIVSEVAGRTLYRLEVKDLIKESESGTFAKSLPSWIHDALLIKVQPKINRVNFVLLPYSQTQVKVTTNKERLNSIDLIQVKKLKEHVHQKILNLNTPTTPNETTSNSIGGGGGSSNSVNGSIQSRSNSLNDSTGGGKVASNPVSEWANKNIELICSDQILSDPEMSLRTIRHLIWKGSGDVLIMYRVKS